MKRAVLAVSALLIGVALPVGAQRRDYPTRPPGAASIARGRPFVAWIAWVPVAALLGLGAVSHWTPVLPAPILGGSTLTAVLSVLALAAWFGVRFLWARWAAED